MPNPVAYSQLLKAMGFGGPGGGGAHGRKPSSWSAGLAASLSGLTPRALMGIAQESQMQKMRPWEYIINPTEDRINQRNIAGDKLDLGYADIEARRNIARERNEALLEQLGIKERGATRRTKMQEAGAAQRLAAQAAAAMERAKLGAQTDLSVAEKAAEAARERLNIQTESQAAQQTRQLEFKAYQDQQNRELKQLQLQALTNKGKTVPPELFLRIYNIWRREFEDPITALEATMKFLRKSGMAPPVIGEHGKKQQASATIPENQDEAGVLERLGRYVYGKMRYPFGNMMGRVTDDYRR